MGVFALEPIAAGTIFLDCYADDDIKIHTNINDLAYHGPICNYDTNENIEQNINVGYIVRDHEHEFMRFFGHSPKNVYLYALKDIKESEELSRYYGRDYWSLYEFWQRFPNNQYQSTGSIEDLPSDWVYIDEIRAFLAQNYNKKLFAKKANDQYHYFVSCSKPNYFDLDFADQINDIVIITKNDYSAYKFDEMIYDGMFLTKYLKEKYDRNNNICEPECSLVENYVDNRSIDYSYKPESLSFADYDEQKQKQKIED